MISSIIRITSSITFRSWALRGGIWEDIKVNWFHNTVVLSIIVSLNGCLLAEENGRGREGGMKIKSEECQLRSKMSLRKGQR